MEQLKQYLAAVELMKRTREAVGGGGDPESDDPALRLANGALALATAELEAARKRLLEHIDNEGLPAVEISADRVASGRSVASIEHWLQELADERKRKVYLRLGEKEFSKSPKSASGSVAFVVL